MEWTTAEGFPQEMSSNVQHLDIALTEMESVVDRLVSVPLSEAHLNVRRNKHFRKDQFLNDDCLFSDETFGQI